MPHLTEPGVCLTCVVAKGELPTSTPGAAYTKWVLYLSGRGTQVRGQQVMVMLRPRWILCLAYRDNCRYPNIFRGLLCVLTH